MKLPIVYRLVFVSAINYLFGNVTFAGIWTVSKNYFMYWQVAVLSTFIASIFSFYTQSRFIFSRNQDRRFISWRYILFQIIGLFGGVLFIKNILILGEFNIILLQFIWSGAFSVATLLILREKKF